MRERLRSSMRAGALALIAALLLGAPAPAAASSTAEKVFDVVVLRPLGFTSLVVGGVFYVPALLVSLPYGSEGREEAYRIFIGAPLERAVERPLGDF